MPKADIYYNNLLAGVLEKRGTSDYRFTYNDAYFADPANPSVSVTLPKSKKEHQSPVLFSFFAGLLAEGINKDIQCRLLKIDEEDDFTRLLKTAVGDTIGAITVREIND